MNKRTNQGGSVAGFVIVAVILVALVGGGVYLVNQRNASEVATQPGTNTTTDDSNKDSQQDSSSSSSQQNSGSTSNGGASSSTNGNTNSSSNTQSNNSSSKSNGSTQNQAATPTTGTGHLPTTGPVDDGLKILAAALLIGMTTAYVRSTLRKQQPSL